MSATFLKSSPRVNDLPLSEKPQIAMVGRSNVGKSTLINDLTGQSGLARVSAEPGRTQMINAFDVDGRYLLIDLPGYGYAKTSKEKRAVFADMIQDYLWESQQLRLVLLIIDARIGMTDLDQEMRALLEANQIPFIVVANKVDKLSRSELTNMMRQLDALFLSATIIPHSSVSGIGKGELLSRIQASIA